VGRLIESEGSRRQFFQESRWHTQSFARFIQTQLGRRYGLANQVFPSFPTSYSLSGGAYALHPYYRESRRLIGLSTPDAASASYSATANDHHYPGVNFPLKQKIHPLGGRWTGTPTIPYGCLIPAQMDGLLVKKYFGVSHCQWCY